ncbi:unnamed protein product [Cuscuta europaea]|uniref:Retrotransposon Copia-like N-terminal domain-containing protein n=1 Tax=Cuscuta europaea TaxID=41803 RepID=A0A9P1DWY2_CUSEU|nr:unnamed protein product [Cuscuta europaea]
MLNPSQFPEKLDGSNYLVWRDQVMDLLFGAHLDQYIDKNTNPPPKNEADNLLRWNRQDRLLRHTLVSSLSSACKPLVGSSKTSASVWKTLEPLYGTRSASKIRSLKDQFRHMKQGSQPVSEYLHHLHTLADELAMAGRPVDDGDFAIQALEGLRPEFEAMENSIRPDEVTFEDAQERSLESHRRCNCERSCC